MKFRSKLARLAAPLLLCPLAAAADVSPVAQKTADYAVDHYEAAMTDTLAELVHFKTVARDDLPMEKNPEFTGFKRALCDKAEALGLECEDHGYVVIVALGQGPEKIGIVTHGDVQPANPAKWKKSPFVLDRTSEPGKLIARGSEDDKGPIATALYAMKSIKDQGVPMKRRVELIVYLAEESNWGPLKAFLKDYDMPAYNITIDADYPVVTAEKGWSEVRATFVDKPLADKSQPYLSDFHGGYFRSQVPDEAHATIVNPSAGLEKAIRARAATHPKVKYEFARKDGKLEVTARGVATHSSEPQHGINAIAFLADALGAYQWPANAAGATVRYINDLIGTGILAEKFGNIAYSDDFMGPMTGALTMVKADDKGLTSYLNLRRPTGKSADKLDAQIHSAIDDWQKATGIQMANVGVDLGDPYRVDNAPQVEPLLQVFRHFTGIKNAGPVAIGGSTNAKLLPSAVSFGPSMPDKAYTGHSEHEFMTVDQLRLNLKMYTAMMIEIANL
ncbi:dipeptidase [Microbulbifer sp. SAOS-129_SWC]|uniref:dipeptidase n=1 Tax=Microbulbifer sp. SAOS-129_SWC TaxID=3145235 RepID=UPI0032167D6A